MVSKPCEHSGIACRPAKCAGTCDFSSLALLFGQVLFGNIYAFFWQNVAIYVLFCKNIDIDAIFWQNVAIYALFSRFRPNSQKLVPVPPLSFYQPCLQTSILPAPTKLKQYNCISSFQGYSSWCA